MKSGLVGNLECRFLTSLFCISDNSGSHYPIPEFLRCAAFQPFEEPDEMLWMLEAQRFGNLLNCTCRIEHPLFGYSYHL